MGWVSFLEDTLERIQDNIRLAEESLRKPEAYKEEYRIASLRALGDAKAIMSQAWEHLELATSPELEYAHEIKVLQKKAKSLEMDLKVTRGKFTKYKHEAEKSYAQLQAELQDAKHEIKALKKKKRKLEKQIEKMVRADFASAVETFSSPGMLQKHKPDT